MSELRLSICIATFMRGTFIGETLRTIVPQLGPHCEIVIVDGASQDHTAEVVGTFSAANVNVRYFKEPVNSGVDRDYDKAVSYARGQYCWLMTDDDLLAHGAIDKVLDALQGDPELVIVNSRVCTADLTKVLRPSSVPSVGRSEFRHPQMMEFFEVTGAYLSFIGCVVIKRELWLSRLRDAFFGTLFVHVGVILQTPLIAFAKIVRDPLVTIRYGNAMWTARGFEIWMFKWPELIWSFGHLPDRTRLAICAPMPYRSARRLVWYRALGGYSVVEFERFLRKRLNGPRRVGAVLLARFPQRLANAISAMYFSMRPDSGSLAIYELSLSQHAAAITKYLQARASCAPAEQGQVSRTHR